MLLNYTIAPIPSWNLILFIVSALVLIMGITTFNLGVDISLIPIGEHIGSALVKTKKLLLIIVLTFFIGAFITMAEPDLIVLAGQINGVPDAIIIIAVSLGVGLALVGAFADIISVSAFVYTYWLLCVGLYSIGLHRQGFPFYCLGIGVTTGPIMVPL